MNVSRPAKKQARTEVAPVDVHQDHVQASVGERVAMLIDLRDIPVEALKKVVVQPKRRIESLDGISPSLEEPRVIPACYKGIHVMSMNSILQNIFAQSICGQIGITSTDYSVRQSVLRDMCERLLQCSSEAESVELLMLDCENAITFNFYYAGRDKLSDCIIGDGFCAL